MFFHSVGFLFLFLPAFLLLMLVLPRGWPRAVCVFGFSYVFYSGSQPVFVLLLLTSSLLDFFMALQIADSANERRRKLWLSVSVVSNLSMLGFFKYGAFFLENAAPLGGLVGLPRPDPDFYKTFVLPAGISFYTFQSLGYTIDVYRKRVKPERSLISFLNFVAYLPQLIAGPIERYSHLAPQLQKLEQGRLVPRWSAGLDRLALGLIQKLFVADSCGHIVDTLANDPSPTFLSAWAIAIGFGLQIYYDFAAYSHMAIGISMMVGIRLAENFLSPYKAESIQDFWRRWHVTFSTWLRDYLYISLGGSHGTAARTFFNVILTFLLCGLWHGAGWNFVLWGLIHGLLVGGFHLYKSRIPAFSLPRGLGIGLTFVSVSFAWILFRFSDLGQVARLWTAMLGLGTPGSGVAVADLLFLAVVAAGTLLLRNAAERWPGSSGAGESLALWMLALFAVFSAPQVNQFIYFQF